MGFEDYLKKLEKHESEVLRDLDTREKIRVSSGIRLNHISDFVGNPKTKFILIKIPADKVLFTGTTEPEWNKILIERCKRSPAELKKLILKHPELKPRFSHAKFSKEPILVKKFKDKYKVFDGMHRFVGAVLENKDSVEAFVAINEAKPICEAHVIYDLIKGFLRSEKTKKDKQDLFSALRLLKKSYENTEYLLKNRFNAKYEPDKDLQKIINKIVR
jgi:hypothetical protein